MFNIRPYDIFVRHLNLTSPVGIKTNVVANKAYQLAAKVSLAVNRLRRPQLDPASRESLVICLFVEAALYPRRRNLKEVSIRDQVFYIQQRSDLLADRLAIAVADAARFVDVNAQHEVVAWADPLPMD